MWPSKLFLLIHRILIFLKIFQGINPYRANNKKDVFLTWFKYDLHTPFAGTACSVYSVKPIVYKRKTYDFATMQKD